MHFCTMKYLLFAFLSYILLGCPAAKTSIDTSIEKTVKTYQIAFYNVENLFDTINAPEKRDGEYTPEGSKEWDTEKYLQKLDRIAQVIASIDSVETLAAIGLAEIENLLVLEDLSKHKSIAHLGLQIIHKESLDFRGIDVALLYNPKLLKEIERNFIEVDINDGGKTTRDILKARLVDNSNDTVVVYVNHWPSRWGGTEASNPKRIAAATALRMNLDKEKPDSKVLIIGDLNDYPINESVISVLGADSVLGGRLYNATFPIHADSTQGTHAYRGHWGVLDHAILSNNLMTDIDSVYVHKRPYMLYKTRNGDWFPSRTHSGKKYFAGYSDHLPIVVNFK